MSKKSMYFAEATAAPEQRAIIDKKMDHSYIVRGCAGSGKSYLALLKIKMLADMNTGDYYLITLVRNLVEYLRNELCANGISAENLITHYEWNHRERSASYARRYGIPQDKRNIIANPSYLLVDECQDLEIGELMALKDAVKEHIFLYGDDEQQIMEFAGRNPAMIDRIASTLDLPIYSLIFNYRLPKKVASFAQEISGNPQLENHCKEEAGEKPYVVKVSSLEEQIDMILDLKENKNYEDVGILCKTDNMVSEIVGALKGRNADVSGKYSLNDAFSHINPASTYKVMNYHQAKGRQFEAVFMLLEDDDIETNVLYVGITRTYRALYILYETQLPAIIRSIPKKFYRRRLDELDGDLIQV